MSAVSEAVAGIVEQARSEREAAMNAMDALQRQTAKSTRRIDAAFQSEYAKHPQVEAAARKALADNVARFRARAAEAIEEIIAERERGGSRFLSVEDDEGDEGETWAPRRRAEPTSAPRVSARVRVEDEEDDEQPESWLR